MVEAKTIEPLAIEDDPDFEWETVSNDFRTVGRPKFLKNEITEALLKGDTIKLTGNKGDRFYRWAKANGWTLHRRIFDGFIIMWITPKEEE